MEQQHISLKNVGNSQPMDLAEARYEEGTIAEDNLIVRINGILPDFSSLGSEEKSERAQEIKRQGITRTLLARYMLELIQTDKFFIYSLI
jgi:hypothetical protein